MLINVLGLGNVLFGDEGFGVEVIRTLRDHREWPAEVQLLDGGTLGLALLEYVEGPDCLLVFDAIIPLEHEFKVHVYSHGELPAFIHRKMSAHQMGFSELLSLAKLHDQEPGEIALIGVPPRSMEMGDGLSPDVAALVPEAVKAGSRIIESWLEGFA